MKITVVGVGLLGGSLALQAKEKGVVKRIIGVDANPENADKALELGIVDEIGTLEEAIPLTDLVVLATPVNVISSLLPRVLDALPDGKVVVDLGSTKEIICRAVENHPRRRQYVAAHPIAGTENSGPDAAFSGLLKRKTMILCDQEKSSNAALNLVVSLAQSLEMRLSFMNSVEHDRHLAYVSHLSHISSFALGVTVLDKEKDESTIFDMAGSGFSSTVRLAKSSPDMWAPIFTQNTENISRALDAYIKRLQRFKEVIDGQDEARSREIMQQANEIRRVLQGIDVKLGL
ncbi:MAG: prephenate dehydrogenase [Cytophagales bacterium]|nr:prephenate dehydrogenase [Cytophagales bacterium]